MGTKYFHCDTLETISTTYDVLSRNDGIALLETLLLSKCHTTGSGSFENMSELAYFIHECILLAHSLSSEDVITYDGSAG